MTRLARLAAAVLLATGVASAAQADVMSWTLSDSLLGSFTVETSNAHILSWDITTADNTSHFVGVGDLAGSPYNFPAVDGISMTLAFTGALDGTSTELLNNNATLTDVHGNSASAHFTATADSVPEPASLALLGLGLAGLAGVRRRSR